MDEVKEMVSQWLALREENEAYAERVRAELNEQVRRDFAEMGRMYDPYD